MNPPILKRFPLVDWLKGGKIRTVEALVDHKLLAAAAAAVGDPTTSPFPNREGGMTD